MRADSTVLKTIKDRRLIDSGDILILGLSGGPDSLCLLDILAGLQQELNFTLYALHVNHQIRGEEADSDMLSAAMACRDRDVKLTVKIANIPEIAKRNGLSEEDAGRRVRHQALAAKAMGLKRENPERRVKIVLAHNKDDQAETVLMRIIRGTGVHGLGAMEYIRNDGLIRPLLDVPRIDVEEYCKEKGLKPCIDSSNASTEYTRNKIRLNLIPEIEREFNPNLKDCLVRLADAAREDDKCLNSIARRSLPQFVVKGEQSKTEDWDSMPCKQLAEMDPAVAKRVVKLMFARCGLKSDIAAVHMNALLDAVKTKTDCTIEFPKLYKAVIAGGKLSFRAPEPKEKVKDAADEKSESKAKPSFGVICMVIPIEELPSLNSIGKDCCVLDALKLLSFDSDIYIRTRRSGDKIKPLCGPGTKKLQDYFTDEKVPKEERDNIPLMCCGHTVLWIKNYTVSDLCKVDDDTDFVLVTKIEEGKEIE